MQTESHFAIFLRKCDFNREHRRNSGNELYCEINAIKAIHRILYQRIMSTQLQQQTLKWSSGKCRLT